MLTLSPKKLIGDLWIRGTARDFFVSISTCSSSCCVLEIKDATGEMRASQPKKHKSACDQCNASKVKCPGGGAPCQRCADSSQPCHYSLARRIGKPRGSKNRKTLEKLRQAEEASLENSSGREGADSSIPQYNGSRNDGDEPLDDESEQRKGEDYQNSLRMADPTGFWSLSPLTNYPNLLDSSQLMSMTEQDIVPDEHGVTYDDSERAVLEPADSVSPDVGGSRGADSRMPWADAPDDYWNVSSLSCYTSTLSN